MSEIQELEPDATLLRIAGGISDEAKTDWEAEKRRHPELSDSIERLRLVASLVRAAHAPVPAAESPLDASRSPTVTSPPAPDAPAAAWPAGAPAIRTWGPLTVIEPIGEGGFGWVFRAHDPNLDCDVALKLWRAEAGRTREKLLEEARRLARVRHDNVVVVHGADCFDGRAGMWTELLHGESLEQRLLRHGRFGAREASAIGIEVCRALCAMHAAGIVHRDVKTFNVVRTDQGRYVLLDFGCAGDLTPDGEVARSEHIPGTPATMAPEQLLGGSVGPAADLYGLGVLLYRLVSGAYPMEARSYGELVERHRTGGVVPLLDRRPDLPASFIHVVETAMDPDPARRFASAGAMEQALHDVGLEASAKGEPGGSTQAEAAPVPVPVRPQRPWWVRHRWVLTTAAAVAVIAGAAVLLNDRPVPGPRNGGTGGESEAQGPSEPAPQVPNPASPTPTPTAAPAPVFEVNIGLYLTTAEGEVRLVPGARVAPGDALHLEIRGSEKLWVYAFNEDAQGEAYVLFPAKGLDVTNPLAPNEDHRLPGTAGGQEASWQITSAGSREHVLVVASRKPLPEVESELAKLPTPTPGAPVVYHRASNEIVAHLRGMGGLVTGPANGAHAPNSALRPIVHALPDGPMPVRDPYVWRIELENPVK